MQEPFIEERNSELPDKYRQVLSAQSFMKRWEARECLN